MNYKLLRISELKNQYKDALITVKLKKMQEIQGTQETQVILRTQGTQEGEGIQEINPFNTKTLNSKRLFRLL